MQDEEKRLANVMTRKEDDKKKEMGRITHLKVLYWCKHLGKHDVKSFWSIVNMWLCVVHACVNIQEKKKNAINNAQKQWEMFHVDTPGSENR